MLPRSVLSTLPSMKAMSARPNSTWSALSFVSRVVAVGHQARWSRSLAFTMPTRPASTSPCGTVRPPTRCQARQSGMVDHLARLPLPSPATLNRLAPLRILTLRDQLSLLSLLATALASLRPYRLATQAPLQPLSLKVTLRLAPSPFLSTMLLAPRRRAVALVGGAATQTASKEWERRRSKRAVSKKGARRKR